MQQCFAAAIPGYGHRIPGAIGVFDLQGHREVYDGAAGAEKKECRGSPCQVTRLESTGSAVAEPEEPGSAGSAPEEGARRDPDGGEGKWICLCHLEGPMPRVPARG